MIGHWPRLFACLLFVTVATPSYPEAGSQLIVRFAPGSVESPLGRTSASIDEFTFASASLRNALIDGGVERLTRLFPAFRSQDRFTTNLIGEPVVLEDLSEFYLATLRGGDVEGADQRLRSIREIAYVDWPKKGVLLSAVVPDDPYFDRQWGLNNDSTLTLCPGYGGPDPLEDVDINAPEAWDIETGDASVRVGVIDSGIYADHDDFEGRVDPDSGASFVYVMPPPDPYPAAVPCDPDETDCDYGPVTPDDDNGHGTSVAGIIAASGDNNAGTAGVAWGVTPISIKVADCLATITSCNSGRALNWARTKGIPILNMSYGLPLDGSELAAVRNAFYSGELLVAASGNDNNGSITYPAAYRSMVCAVGAYFMNGRRWVDSLITHASGPTKGSCYGPALDLAAPGGHLIAAPDFGGRQFTNKYLDLSSCTSAFGGTSAAAPIVAGVAALIRSKYDAHGASGTEPLLGEDLYQAMIITAKHPDLDEFGQEKAFDDSAGFGHVRADTALKLLALPREVYHELVTRLLVVDTFTTARTLRHMPGLPSADSTYTVKCHVLRKTVPFNPTFASTPIVWARSSGSAGAKDTTTFDYYYEVNYGRIVAVTTDSVTVETNLFKIIGVSAAYEWFPGLNSAVALTAVGEPTGGGGGRGGTRAEAPREGERGGLPTSFALRQNRSNPFSSSTRILFDLPKESPVRLEIFDAQGRLVRKLADRVFPAGFHSVEWDGRAESGEETKPGVYLCRMRAASFRDERKMVLLGR